MARPHSKILTTLAFVSGLISAPANAAVAFTDTSFNLADYTVVGPTKSDPAISITDAQCATCGNPGQALQVIVTVPTSGSVSIGFINNGFTYDPSVQGALASIAASEDKNLTTTLAGTLGSNFRSLLYQNGSYYVASIPFPNFTGPGSTGYQTASGTLTASDFTVYDFATRTFGVGNPNFAGSSFKLGIAQISNANNPATSESDYDNLHFVLSAVPEPPIWLMMLTGIAVVGLALRRNSNRLTAA